MLWVRGFEPSLFEPGVYFNIKCIGKLLGPTNEFERSMVFETGEFERPKFDCIDVEKYYMYATYNFTMCANFTKCEILVWKMWCIGTNFSRAVKNWYQFSQCEICEMWNLRFNRASMPFKPAQGHRLQVNISSLMFYGEMTKPFQLP